MVEILTAVLADGPAAVEAAYAAALAGGACSATRVLHLAYLAPDIVTAILDGRQPAGLSARRLLTGLRLPLDWTEQRQVLGFI